MNKFALIALLAVVCQVAHGFGSDFDDWSQPLEIEDEQNFKPQVGLTPSDEEEVTDLQPNKAAFKDFCLASRDYVIGDIKNSANGLASSVFNLIFKTADDVILDTKRTQEDATSRLSRQLQNPNTPVPDVASNEVDKIIIDGQKKIQEKNSIFTAVTSVFQAAGTAFARSSLDKLNLLKDAYGLFSTVDAVSEGCAKIAQYEQEVNRMFEEARQKAAAQDPSLANVQLNDVWCITSKRVGRFEGLCKFAKVAQGPLMKMFTYRP